MTSTTAAREALAARREHTNLKTRVEYVYEDGKYVANLLELRNGAWVVDNGEDLHQELREFLRSTNDTQTLLCNTEGVS